MVILGLNAYHGDVSAVLLADGMLLAAVEEERLRRVKHWAGFPARAIQECLRIAGLPPSRIDLIAVGRDPRVHFWRKAAFACRRLPNPGWLWNRLSNKYRFSNLSSELALLLGMDSREVVSRLNWVEHHPSHLASAFYSSPFEEAAVCALDGFGDFVSTSWGWGRGSRLRILRRLYFPHSLGLLYTAITQFLGFWRYGDEYKVMGLAAYGEPELLFQLRKLVRLLPDGGFSLNLNYFSHWKKGDEMSWEGGEPTIGRVFSQRLGDLLGPPRHPDEPLQDRHRALAASLQKLFEECVFHVLRALHQQTGLRRLALAGGCAMNSLANGKIRQETPFEEIFIQPASPDNGTALGAALYLYHQILGKDHTFQMTHGYWGREFSASEMEAAVAGRAGELRRQGCRVARSISSEELVDRSVRLLTQGRVLGWFQGRMEWGARALGNRSILADPRRAEIRDRINYQIKSREPFRPFAPSILAHEAGEFLEECVSDPFMTRVFQVRPSQRRRIPAVVHADGTARAQTVDRQTNPLYFKLLKGFHQVTGVPLLLNTSLNCNEPIVHCPEEALDCFLRTGMDALALGPFLITRP